MIYGYIRVSTDKQTVKNQEFEIINFATKNQITIDKWIKETISSRVELENRKLGKLLKKIKKGDIIITSEISRLGRNILQIMSILHYCMDKNVAVWTIKDGYRLGTDIQSKVLAFAFGLSAEIERNLISQRTKEALNRLKNEGKVIGRKEGSKNSHHKLDGKEEIIINMINQGITIVSIAKAVGVTRRTIYNFLKEI